MKIHYNNGEKQKIITNILSIMPEENDSAIMDCVSKSGKVYKIHIVNIKFIYDDELANPSLEMGGSS